MHTLIPTKDTGATAKANAVVYVEPDRTETDESLAAQFQLPGVDAAFVADLLSAHLTHERCGTHLYRSVAARTLNPVLRARYEELGRQTARHVEVLEEVIVAAGGNPSYASPLARVTEAADSKALEATYLASGGVDPMAAEMAMLDAVFMAETVDQANWETLGQLAEVLPAGAAQERLAAAVREVLADEDEHLGWAQDTRARLTMLQASSSTLSKAAASGEELVARVRGWFSDADRSVGDADASPTTARPRKQAASRRATSKAGAKKSAAKKSAAKKSAAKKSAAKKSAAKKSAAKKSAAKKSAAKKSAAKKSAAKKSAAKKSAAKKSPAKKRAAKKTAGRRRS